MSQRELAGVIRRIAEMQAGWSDSTELRTMRADLDNFHRSFGGVIGSTSERLDAGGVQAEFVSAPGIDSDRVVLYLHGGGFSVGSAKSHRHLAEWLSAIADVRVLVVDYRLVPEYRFPAQLEDATKAYNWLLRNVAIPAHIAVAGDSAGAGLALSLLVALRDEAAPMPACAVLISLWADLLCCGSSYRDNAEIDPVATCEMAVAMGAEYVRDSADPADPLASPIHAELHGLPPLLLQVGTRDIFLDDSRTVAMRSRLAGVDVQLAEWPGMIHQWHMYAAVLEEARAALSELGGFLERHFGP